VECIQVAVECIFFLVKKFDFVFNTEDLCFLTDGFCCWGIVSEFYVGVFGDYFASEASLVEIDAGIAF